MDIWTFWFLFAVVVGVIAGARGRSGIGWFILAVIISPLLALILVALLPNAKAAPTVPGGSDKGHFGPGLHEGRREWNPDRDLRKCPEFVQREARKCKHCGSVIEPLPEAAAPLISPNKPVGPEPLTWYIGHTIGKWFRTDDQAAAASAPKVADASP